ncbi:hypothetical protein D3C75_689270 [compost metagenome]
MHPLRAAARDAYCPGMCVLQQLIAGDIVDFKLIAITPAEDKLHPVIRQQRIQGGDIRPDGARGYRQPLRQLVLRQRFVLQHLIQLR